MPTGGTTRGPRAEHSSAAPAERPGSASRTPRGPRGLSSRGSFFLSPRRTRLISSHPSPLSAACKAEQIYPPRSAATNTSGASPTRGPPRRAAAAAAQEGPERPAQRSPLFRTALTREGFGRITDGADPPAPSGRRSTSRGAGGHHLPPLFHVGEESKTRARLRPRKARPELVRWER